MLKMCRRLGLKGGLILAAILSASPSFALPLSPGDRLEVSIPNEKYFARVYEVNQDGDIEIPFLTPLSVMGLEPSDVEAKLSEVLIEAGYFPAGALQLSVQVLLWAPVQVGISGEVFQPGRVIINEIAEEDRQKSIAPGTQLISGDYPPKRNLTKAISAAGGVLPTADITQIRIIRGNQEKVVDLTGVFTGDPIENIPIIAGDQVIIPTAERFQPELVRPSAITLPGIKVFVSNLTVPASSNSTSAIGNRNEGIDFPYGARLSQAVVATNCAGGIKATSGSRRAVLVRVDRITGETISLERSVEDLLRKSSKDTENPLLMPRDAVACYDSGVTNTRDVFKAISDILNPFGLLLDVIF